MVVDVDVVTVGFAPRCAAVFRFEQRHAGDEEVLRIVWVNFH